MEKYNSYVTPDFKVVKVENNQVQLRKICNHPYIFLDTYLDNRDLIRTCGKFEVLDRILPKLLRAGHRMLIFSQSTELLKILGVFLETQKFHFYSSTVQQKMKKEFVIAINGMKKNLNIVFLFYLQGQVGLV